VTGNRNRILVENLKARIHLEDLGIDGRIILKWFLKKRGARMWTRFIWLGIRSSDGFLWTR
jgi:hypothetical protein